MSNNKPHTPNICFHMPPGEMPVGPGLPSGPHEGTPDTIGDLFNMGATARQFGCIPGQLVLPDNSTVPDLIRDVDVAASDVNAILFVINELPNLKKAQALLATLMPVWLATRLSADVQDHAEFHKALTALCNFCDFPPASYDPCLYTVVSPVPPGTILLPALSPTCVTNNCDMDMDSVSGPPAALDIPMVMPAVPRLSTFRP